MGFNSGFKGLKNRHSCERRTVTGLWGVGYEV